MSAFAADPDYLTETRRLMAQAQAAFERGDLAGSADGFVHVARRHPAAVGGWVQAAAAGLRAGAAALALKAARRSVLLDPSASAAAALLTAASTAEPLAGRHRATALWAILHPGKAEALGALASSYQDLGRTGEAERVAREALHADPYLDWVRVNLAVILRESGREGKAETELRRAVIAGPDGNLAWRRMAALAETLSKLELAGRAAGRALVIDAQDHVSALFLSIVERRRGDLDGALHRLQALPEAMDGEAGRDAVEFELGTVLDRLGQYDEAWIRFERGNRIAVQRAPSGAADPRPFLSTLDAFAGAISDGWPARWAPLPEAPPPAVFMVGFPRSGTTLLDQILDAHPDARVIEEQPVLSSVGAGFIAAGKETLAERLATLDEAEAARLRKEYMAKLTRWAGEDRPRVVIDKMPLNTTFARLIKYIFPDSKVIFPVRDPADVVTSLPRVGGWGPFRTSRLSR